MIVRELITRLGFSTNTAQLNNAEKATKRLKDRAEQAAGAFRNIVAAVASLATIRAVIGIADEMQNIRTRIGQLPQTVGDAGAAFDEVATRASAAGVKIDAYASLYTKVGNAAKDSLIDWKMRSSRNRKEYDSWRESSLIDWKMRSSRNQDERSVASVMEFNRLENAL